MPDVPILSESTKPHILFDKVDQCLVTFKSKNECNTVPFLERSISQLHLATAELTMTGVRAVITNWLRCILVLMEERNVLLQMQSHSVGGRRLLLLCKWIAVCLINMESLCLQALTRAICGCSAENAAKWLIKYPKWERGELLDLQRCSWRQWRAGEEGLERVSTWQFTKQLLWRLGRITKH